MGALAGCEQATAQFVARHMRPRVRITHMEFSLEAERDERGSLTLPIDVAPSVPARVARVSGAVHVHTDASQEVVDRIADAVKIRCPLASTMKAGGTALDAKWIAVPLK